MKEALDLYVIRGVNHNVNFLRDVLTNKRYCSGNINTKFIPEEYPEGFTGHVLTDLEQKQLILLSASLQHLRNIRDSSISPPNDEIIDIRKYIVKFRNTETVVEVTPHSSKSFDCQIEGHESTMVDLESYAVDSPVIHCEIGGEPLIAQLYKIRYLGYDIQLCGTVYSVDVVTPRESELYKFMKEPTKLNTANFVQSPMAGTLVSVAVKKGDHVSVGQELAIVEAMKMQNILRATRDGVVKEILGQAGKPVSLDENILEFN